MKHGTGNAGSADGAPDSTRTADTTGLACCMLEEGPGGAGWPAGRLGEVSRPRVAWRDSGSVDLPPAGERRGKSDALVGTMETRSWTKAAKQLPFAHTLVLPVHLALVVKPLLHTLEEHREGSVTDGPDPSHCRPCWKSLHEWRNTPFHGVYHTVSCILSDEGTLVSGERSLLWLVGPGYTAFAGGAALRTSAPKNDARVVCTSDSAGPSELRASDGAVPRGSTQRGWRVAARGYASRVSGARCVRRCGVAASTYLPLRPRGRTKECWFALSAPRWRRIGSSPGCMRSQGTLAHSMPRGRGGVQAGPARRAGGEIRRRGPSETGTAPGDETVSRGRRRARLSGSAGSQHPRAPPQWRRLGN